MAGETGSEESHGESSDCAEEVDDRARCERAM